jgi:hypothetical protein
MQQPVPAFSQSLLAHEVPRQRGYCSFVHAEAWSRWSHRTYLQSLAQALSADGYERPYLRRQVMLGALVAAGSSAVVSKQKGSKWKHFVLPCQRRLSGPRASRYRSDSRARRTEELA